MAIGKVPDGLKKDFESGDYTVRELETKWSVKKSTISRIAKDRGWNNPSARFRTPTTRFRLPKEKEEKGPVFDGLPKAECVAGAFKGKTVAQVKLENPHLVIDDSVAFDALTDIKNCSQSLLNARRIIDVVGKRLSDSKLKESKAAELKALAETNNAALATIIRMRELTRPYEVEGQDRMDPTVYNMALDDRDDLPNLIEQDAEGDLQQDVGPMVETRKSLLHSG